MRLRSVLKAADLNKDTDVYNVDQSTHVVNHFRTRSTDFAPPCSRRRDSLRYQCPRGRSRERPRIRSLVVACGDKKTTHHARTWCAAGHGERNATHRQSEPRFELGPFVAEALDRVHRSRNRMLNADVKGSLWAVRTTSHSFRSGHPDPSCSGILIPGPKIPRRTAAS